MEEPDPTRRPNAAAFEFVEVEVEVDAGAGLVVVAVAGADEPNEICDRPPGGACTRVEERPVMTFPQFWLDPFAYRLELTEPLELLELLPPLSLPKAQPREDSC